MVACGAKPSGDGVGARAALRAPAPHLDVGAARRRRPARSSCGRLGTASSSACSSGWISSSRAADDFLFGLERVDLGHQRVDRFALGLERADLLVERVAARLQFFGAGLERLALGLEGAEGVDVQEGLVLLARFEAGDDRGQVFAEQGDVEHRAILGGTTGPLPRRTLPTGVYGATFWAAGFGMLIDKFGVPWMVNVENPAFKPAWPDRRWRRRRSGRPSRPRAARRRRSASAASGSAAAGSTASLSSFHSHDCAARIASSVSSSASRTCCCVISQAMRADAPRAERIGRDAADLDVDRLRRPRARGTASARARVPAPRRGCARSNQPARPPIRPPPPTLTSTASGRPPCSSISRPSVPAPATTSGWS